MDNQKLQQVLGYARWENFVVAIGRAIESCKTLVISIDDHFREVTKMVQLRPRVGCIFARIPCKKPYKRLLKRKGGKKNGEWIVTIDLLRATSKLRRKS